jgi:urea carboxylase-associated protein 1
MSGILFDGDDVSDDERADHARALAAKMREASVRRAAEAMAKGGAERLARARDIPGKVLSRRVVEPGPFTLKLAAGDRFRIVDLEGQQAVDFLCYDLADFANRYNAANTIKANRSVYLGKGVRLYSDRGDVLMTIVEDTVGHHDTIGGCCSTAFNERRYGIKGTASCYSNFTAALAEHGMTTRDIPANVNFFMNVPVRPDGSTEIVDGLSGPGDYVDLRAERDVLVVISNCPQRYNPCNGWNPTPVELIAWRP